jgi:pectate lyase
MQPNPSPKTQEADPYLKPVIAFAKRVLNDGKDKWNETPLLADGIDTFTGEPIHWNWGDKDRVVSNLACQQNLMRVLSGLTQLTGEHRYRLAAISATRHALQNTRDDRALLYWGGHVAWDLINEQPFGHAAPTPKTFHHELKTNFPDWRFMFEADPINTGLSIRAIWDAQVKEWSCLDLSRHGMYDRPQRTTAMWSDEFKPKPNFFVGTGLSFINAGSDLILAAAELAILNAEPGARVWSRRLAERYITIRDPDTGLGGYQYSQLARDRAQAQFGPELGSLALEGTILDSGRTNKRYGTVAVCMLDLGHRLGPGPGDFFIKWAVEDLRAHQKHVFDSASGYCFTMLVSGKKLNPDVVKRKGYYQAKNFSPYRPGTPVIWAYAKASKLTGDKDLGRTAIRMLVDRGVLGQGSTLDRPVMQRCEGELDGTIIFTLLDLYRIAKNPVFLNQAKIIGSNIIKARFHRDAFLPSAQHIYTCFDYVEPLALLHLAGEIMDKSASLSSWSCGMSDFTAEHPAAVGKNPWNRIGIDELFYNKVKT